MNESIAPSAGQLILKLYFWWEFMSQNPFGQQPYGQPQGAYPNPGQPQPNYPPPKDNTGKVLLIVFGSIGAVVLVLLLACGGLVYYTVSSAKNFVAEISESIEEQRKAEEEFWVDSFKDHPEVQEHIGTIIESGFDSYEEQFDHPDTFETEEGDYVIQQIPLTGTKGDGELVVVGRWNFSAVEDGVKIDPIDVDPDASANPDEFNTEDNGEGLGELSPIEDSDSTVDLESEEIFEGNDDKKLVYLLLPDGERILLDDEAEKIYQDFSFEIDFFSDDESE